MLPKLASGRYLFTLVSAFVFLVMSLKGGLPQDKIIEIIMLVIIFYFNRTDRMTPNQGGETK